MTNYFRKKDMREFAEFWWDSDPFAEDYAMTKEDFVLACINREKAYPCLNSTKHCIWIRDSWIQWKQLSELIGYCNAKNYSMEIHGTSVYKMFDVEITKIPQEQSIFFEVEWNEIRCISVTYPDSMDFNELDKIMKKLATKPDLIAIPEGMKLEFIRK